MLQKNDIAFIHVKLKHPDNTQLKASNKLVLTLGSLLVALIICSFIYKFYIGSILIFPLIILLARHFLIIRNQFFEPSVSLSKEADVNVKDIEKALSELNITNYQSFEDYVVIENTKKDVTSYIYIIPFGNVVLFNLQQSKYPIFSRNNTIFYQELKHNVAAHIHNAKLDNAKEISKH